MTHQIHLRAKHFKETNFANAKECAMAKALMEHFPGYVALEHITHCEIGRPGQPAMKNIHYTHDGYHNAQFVADAKKAKASRFWGRSKKIIRTITINLMNDGYWDHQHITGEFGRVVFRIYQGKLTLIPARKPANDETLAQYGFLTDPVSQVGVHPSQLIYNGGNPHMFPTDEPEETEPAETDTPTVVPVHIDTEEEEVFPPVAPEQQEDHDLEEDDFNWEDDDDLPDNEELQRLIDEPIEEEVENGMLI